jgi:uncharacterized protein (DUF433 family)
MQLEDYFEFLSPDDIRLKGTRVGIETVLNDYLFRKLTPEKIASKYSTLELDQVYATILYYLRNRQTVEGYLTALMEWGRAQREAQARSTDPKVVAFRQRLDEARARR